jgi:ERCC4-type nuclease
MELAVKTLTIDEQAVKTLTSLRGIGRKTALDLWWTFGSLEAVLGADERKLVRIMGIGPTKARQIRRRLKRDHQALKLTKG